MTRTGPMRGTRRATVNALLPPCEPPTTGPVPASSVTSPPSTEAWRGYVGVAYWQGQRVRVWAEVALTTTVRPRRVAGHQLPGWHTIDHEETWRRIGLSCLGVAIPMIGHHAVRMGQISDLVALCSRDTEHGNRGLQSQDRRALVELWRRWHLNDQHLACVHQPDEPGDDGVPQCERSGYVYGSERLIDVMDPKVRARVRQVGTALHQTATPWPREDRL